MTVPELVVERPAPEERELALGSVGGRGPIALHLLVKNGESVVGRLLDCVGPHIAEVVAVLNDCDDKTEIVLAEAALRHDLPWTIFRVTSETRPELYVVDEPGAYREGEPLADEVFPGPHTHRPMLADFAAARNEGWCWEDSRSPWRLFLDADDVVEDPACLPALCRALDGQSVLAASSRYLHGPLARSGGFRERLARNLPEIRWAGQVHERLAGIPPGRAAHLEGSLLVRDMMDSRGGGLRPPLRNLKVLYRHARARGWQVSPRDMVCLAAEARAVMPELAKRLCELALAGAEWPAERSWALVVRGQVAEDEGALEAARVYYGGALREWPSAPPALLMARASFFMGHWADVVAAWELALEHRGRPHPLDDGSADEDGMSLMAAAAMAEVGRHREAEALCLRARELFPSAGSIEKLLSEIQERAKSSSGLPPEEQRD